MYSFGAVLFHMISGTPPWQGASNTTVVIGNLATTLRPRAGCPPFLVELCRRCLDHDANKRPKDGAALLALLRAAGAEGGADGR